MLYLMLRRCAVVLWAWVWLWPASGLFRPELAVGAVQQSDEEPPVDEPPVDEPPVEGPIDDGQIEDAGEGAGPLEELPETTVLGELQSRGDATVVTPTRTPSRASEVGSSVTVIDRDEIERSGKTSVVEVLRGVPGVDVVQQGGPGRVGSVFLRGASSEQTKVLLDGIPLNDPITPGRSFDLANLSLDDVERIEVLRGPQSTLYGSDAIGGVINVITRKGAGPLSGRMGAMGGSFGTARQWAGASGGTRDFNYSFGGSYFDTDGFSAADERLSGNTENDPFYLGTLAGRGGWTPYDNFDVDVVLRYNRALAAIDDGGGPFQDDPNQGNFAEQLFTRTQLRYANPDGWWEQTLAFNFADHNRKNIDPRDVLHPVDEFFSRFNSQLHTLDWQHNLLLVEGNTLTVGATYSDESGSSSFEGSSAFGPFTGFAPDLSLFNTGVFVQDQIQLGDRWFTTVGARQDHYSQAGTADTYRVTSLYRLDGVETAFRGSLGTGFKAPTIFQLFDAFSGNLGLMPEESKGWDYGVEQPLAGGRIVLGSTYFRNDFENLIDFNPSTFQFFNVGRALASGVEVSALWAISETTTVTASYTFSRTRDRATDLPLLRRPANKAGLNLSRRLWRNRAGINLGVLYVDNRDDRDFTTFPFPRVIVPHYIVVNAAGTYDISRSCRLLARVDNLLDERYQEVFGFGTAPISAYGGLEWLW